jgi:hypothetical protein
MNNTSLKTVSVNSVDKKGKALKATENKSSAVETKSTQTPAQKKSNKNTVRKVNVSILTADSAAASTYTLWEKERQSHEDNANWFRAEEELRKSLAVVRK